MNVKRCRDCPKWSGRWCSIYARHQPGLSPACGWGRKFMHREYMKAYMKKYNTKWREQCKKD